VCVVALLSLVLNVRDVDGNTALLLLWGVVNLVERVRSVQGWVLVVKYFGDSRSQSRLTVVNVTMVPMLTCGLVRSNFALAIVGPPDGSVVNHRPEGRL
jgi:hypothetical protein